jgi:phage tail-like protein
MSMSTPGVDDVGLASTYELKLNGLDTLKFTEISGLQQLVTINSSSVGSTTGAGAEARTVVPSSDPITLTLTHAVDTTMSVWQWLDQTLEQRAKSTCKKEGTLSLMSIGGTQKPLQSWNLNDVYINSIALDGLGPSSSSFLTATVTLVVGTCTPM